jgi:putative methionine-R-sulfoxide reductase with GAF domain
MVIKFIQSLPDHLKYLIILVGVVVLFIFGLLPHSFLWITLKIMLFLALLSFLFLIFQDSFEDGDEEDDEDFAKIADVKQEWLQIENDQDVEDLFQKFLDSTLKLIKKVLVSNTVTLLFANYKKKEFTIRHRVTDHPDLFITQNMIDIYKGLPSLVLRNRTPLIENHLPGAQEIIPYYQQNESPSSSFAAVPIFYKDYIIGVLCTDSEVEEAYSNEDLEILRHFGNLITVQIFGSNKLYEYESENWLANVLFDVSQEMNQIQSVEELWGYLLGKLPDIIGCDRISISKKLNEKQGEILGINGGTGNLKIGRQFGFNDGIVGWVMRKNQTLLVDDFSSKENYVPRFSASETPAKEYYSLLALPIATDKKPFAVICLESYRPRNFKEQHKRILQTICNQAANMYIMTRTLDHLRLLNYRDLETQLENLNAFKSLLPKEIKRATKLEYQNGLFFLKIYFQMKEEDKEIHKKTLMEFLSLILPNLSDSDYIFRLFPETFAILVSPLDGVKIQHMAEDLLEKFRQKKIWGDGQVFDFYVSIGIVPPEFITEDVEQVLHIGQESIKQSRLKGPNQIVVFQEIPAESREDGEQLSMLDKS